jgi:RNA-binding protein YlmH
MIKTPVFTDSEDKILYAHLNDCREACMKKRQAVFSGFMDPVRAEKFRLLFSNEARRDNYGGTCVMAWGGYEQAERKILCFYPDGETDILSFGLNSQPRNYGEIIESKQSEPLLTDKDESRYNSFFPIDALQISFNARFNSAPTHRDYLGSILGLGLERTKIGDIRINENGALAYVSRDVSAYIIATLERVGRTPVKISPGEPADTATQPSDIETRITVASPRLDAVIAAAFRLPRTKAAALIEGEKVFINWAAAVKSDKQIKDGDVITVRGYGRIKANLTAGQTKKGRVVLYISKTR